MDPLDQRRPDVGRRKGDNAARAGHTVRFGLGAVVAGAMLVFSPLLLGRGSLNRFIVLAGCLALLVGVGCILNGAIDWLLGRKRR